MVAKGRALWTLLVLVCPRGLALNPVLDVSQYAHNTWTIHDGFFDSSVNTIAQAPDGYLWLGTDLGLLRFDGVRKLAWQPPAGEHLPSIDITKLLAARDGRLWIGTLAGLASWKDGRLVHYPELDGQVIAALLEDRAGTVWVGGTGIPTGRLCAIQIGAVQCFGQDGSLGRVVLSIYEENGNLWAGAETGLWRWKPGPPKRYPMPTPELNDLIEGDARSLLIAMQGGIRQLAGENVVAYPIPGIRQAFNAHHLLRDHNGGLWIGTSEHGLLHLHRRRTDRFTRSDVLSGDYVLALLEDREGSVWVATTEGLDRFRDYTVPTMSAKQGLSNDEVWSVLAASDGSVWLGAPDGLNRWQNGQIRIYTKRDGLPGDGADSLFEDDRGRIWVSTHQGIAWFDNGRFVPVPQASTRVVHNIVEGDSGSFWISDQDQGLIHLLGEKVIEQYSWGALRHQGHATAVARDPKRSGLWLGFYRGGLVFFKDGQVRESYTTAQGLAAGWVSGVRVDTDGSVWAATAGGLSRIKGNHVATINSRNALPCDSVTWMTEDEDHSAWLYMPCGLVRLGRADLDAWIADPNRAVKYTLFDSADGVRSQPFAHGYSPKVAKSGDGRIWFATLGGVSVIDPRDLRLNNLPPPVYVERITADRKIYWGKIFGAAPSKLRLPPLVRDLEIDYTALSFVAPGKNRFRYKLEGRDREWVDAGNRRQAFYNDLPPRQYRFRVMACNNNGVWNETGDTLEFSIAPTFYQTYWFLVACVAVVLATLFGLYRLRLYQIARELKAQLEGQLEGRVDERLRVARELHDTLLQSFQGVLLRFQGARNLLPGRVAEAGQVLEAAVDDAAKAITEARNAVQDLRSSTVVTNDLAKAIQTLGEDLAGHQTASNGNAPTFSVSVEGASQGVHPILRDEVYRITAEAMRNAFKHARARRIEVEICYGPRDFCVRVRDDGAGIDASVLGEERREGHFGLAGMRERARGIGGKLEVWSERGAGTEVELTLPASVAYGHKPGPR